MSKQIFSNTRVLITGGTGSWGHELTSQILTKYPHVKEVRIYSRNEHKQVEMKREFKNDKRLTFIIGDIRDKNILGYAMKDVDFVFHLAALKHIPVVEDNSWEAVLTNIYGTQNVIEAAIANNVSKVIDVSTDKAVDAFNLYGVTKACGEKLVINANFNYPGRRDRTPAFICIRGGNVIGTSGSVIPLFKKQLQDNNEITVTNLEMTRYLMSTKEAIGLIFTAIKNASGGELFVMRMPAATIQTIADTMIRLFGNKKSKIKIIGERPGEKKHEILVSKNETINTRILSDNYYVITPQIKQPALEKKYKKFKKIKIDEFSSFNAVRLSQRDLENILKKEAYLWDEQR